MADAVVDRRSTFQWISRITGAKIEPRDAEAGLDRPGDRMPGPFQVAENADPVTSVQDAGGNLRHASLASRRSTGDDEAGLHAYRIGSRILFRSLAQVDEPEEPFYVALGRNPAADAADGKADSFHPLLRDLETLDLTCEATFGPDNAVSIIGQPDRRQAWLSPEVLTQPFEAVEGSHGCQAVRVGDRLFQKGTLHHLEASGQPVEEVVLEARLTADGALGGYHLVLGDFSAGGAVSPYGAKDAGGRFVPSSLEIAGEDAPGTMMVQLDGELIEARPLGPATFGEHQSTQRWMPVGPAAGAGKNAPRKPGAWATSGKPDADLLDRMAVDKVLVSTAPGSRTVVPIGRDRSQINFIPGRKPVIASEERIFDESKAPDDYAATGIRLLEGMDNFVVVTRRYYVPIEQDGKKIFALYKPSNPRDLHRGNLMVRREKASGEGLPNTVVGPQVAYNGLTGGWGDATWREDVLLGWKEQIDERMSRVIASRMKDRWWQKITGHALAENEKFEQNVKITMEKLDGVVDRFMEGKVDRHDFVSDVKGVSDDILGRIEGLNSSKNFLSNGMLFVIFGAAGLAINLLSNTPAIWANVATNLSRGSTNPGRTI